MSLDEVNAYIKKTKHILLPLCPSGSGHRTQSNLWKAKLGVRRCEDHITLHNISSHPKHAISWTAAAINYRQAGGRLVELVDSSYHKRELKTTT